MTVVPHSFFYCLSHQESLICAFGISVFISLLLTHKTNYIQFYSVCNWLIVVSPLAKGELLDQNYTSLITWPPKAHYMSKRTEVPPVVESYIYQLNAKDFQKVITTYRDMDHMLGWLLVELF